MTDSLDQARARRANVSHGDLLDPGPGRAHAVLNADGWPDAAQVKRWILEILTNDVNGEEELALRLTEDLVIDSTTHLAAAFASTLRLVKDLIRFMADEHGITPAEMLREIASASGGWAA